MIQYWNNRQINAVYFTYGNISNTYIFCLVRCGISWMERIHCAWFTFKQNGVHWNEWIQIETAMYNARLYLIYSRLHHQTRHCLYSFLYDLPFRSVLLRLTQWMCCLSYLASLWGSVEPKMLGAHLSWLLSHMNNIRHRTEMTRYELLNKFSNRSISYMILLNIQSSL